MCFGFAWWLVTAVAVYYGEPAQIKPENMEEILRHE
jgi:hypothetical protein